MDTVPKRHRSTQMRVDGCDDLLTDLFAFSWVLDSHLSSGGAECSSDMRSITERERREDRSGRNP